MSDLRKEKDNPKAKMIAENFPIDVSLDYFESGPMEAVTRTFEVSNINLDDFKTKGAPPFMQLLIEQILQERQGRNRFSFRALPILIHNTKAGEAILYCVGGWS